MPVGGTKSQLLWVSHCAIHSNNLFKWLIHLEKKQVVWCSVSEIIYCLSMYYICIWTYFATVKKYVLYSMNVDENQTYYVRHVVTVIWSTNVSCVASL